jgi:flagellar basal body-associated protein FliL
MDVEADLKSETGKSKAEPQKMKSRSSFGIFLIILLLLAVLTCAVMVAAFFIWKKYASSDGKISPVEQIKNFNQTPKPRGADEPTEKEVQEFLAKDKKEQPPSDKKEEKREKNRWYVSISFHSNKLFI